MRNKEKILKQNSLRSGINIKIGLFVVGLGLAVWLVSAFGASLSAVVAVVAGYYLLKLIWRLLQLILTLIFTLVSIFALVAIFSLIF